MPTWGPAGLGVLALGVVLLALDRAVAHGWFDGVRVTLRPRTDRSARARAASGGMLGELMEVFQPTRTHVVAEQQRQALDARREGDGAPPDPAPPQDTEPTVA